MTDVERSALLVLGIERLSNKELTTLIGRLSAKSLEPRVIAVANIKRPSRRTERLLELLADLPKADYGYFQYQDLFDYANAFYGGRCDVLSIKTRIARIWNVLTYQGYSTYSSRPQARLTLDPSRDSSSRDPELLWGLSYEKRQRIVRQDYFASLNDAVELFRQYPRVPDKINPLYGIGVESAELFARFALSRLPQTVSKSTS